MENNSITPTPQPAPQPAAPMPTFGAASATSTPASSAPQPAPVAPAPVAPAPGVTTPAPVATPAPTPTPAPMAPTQAPAAPVVPAASAESIAAPQNPINKGRLIALIAIIAGLLISGIIAAVVIVNVVNRRPDPVATANAALLNFADPAHEPKSVSGSVEIADTDASASFVLHGSNLYLSYTGLSDLLGDKLGLDEVADEASVSSLMALSKLIEFGEDEWWQIPLEGLTLASEYRAHPFLAIASATDNGYRLKIDTDKLPEINLEDNEYTAIIPGSEQLPSALRDLPEFAATIDSENRFSRFYLAATEDLPVDITINFNYDSEPKTPEEYRPITELVSKFLETIGY